MSHNRLVQSKLAANRHYQLRSQSLSWPAASFSASLRRSLREQFVPLLAPQTSGWAVVKTSGSAGTLAAIYFVDQD